MLMYTMILQFYAKIVLIMSYAEFEFKWSKYYVKQNTYGAKRQSQSEVAAI